MNKAEHNTLVDDFLNIDLQLKEGGVHLLDELTKNSKYTGKQIPKDEFIHFPSEDVVDSNTGSQYFLHRHSSELIEDSIHVHYFKRWRPIGLNLPLGDTITTHLAALEFDCLGNPLGWFTVNQWVVADYWQPARDTINLFKDWKINSADDGRGESINPKCHEWLEAYMKLSLHNDIYELLVDRDEKLDALVECNPDKNVFENREIEILGYRKLTNRIAK